MNTKILKFKIKKKSIGRLITKITKTIKYIKNYKSININLKKHIFNKKNIKLFKHTGFYGGKKIIYYHEQNHTVKKHIILKMITKMLPKTKKRHLIKNKIKILIK